ncbi:transposase [Xanthomonas oryzae pv. oryzicola BLS256]|uniref:Transposase n=1 Tax=Xanthomonas oryzae pv. oryzicola (strain BLS256) TaxID=383407 RepID=G7TK32_XANOB|nr:transposase [Xanthomonas oryzae pv. oryzicola BLS256]QEO96989.1 transposase [Xanthomonas oryzae pv. oryzicola]
MAVRNFGGTSLFQQVRDDLVLYRWSPQQIAAKLKAMHPDDPSQRVSHETIYAAIYAHPRGGLKQRACGSASSAQADAQLAPYDRCQAHVGAGGAAYRPSA